jgi:hypothetical protein
VEKPDLSSTIPLQTDPAEIATFDWRHDAQARLALYEQERAEAQKKRRAGRPKGELTHSLIEKLRDCNVLQLKNVKKRCDREIERQSHAPRDYDCSQRYTVRVLNSVTVKKVRFRLEFRRTSLRSKKVYVNGPYVRRYWWDGSIVKSEHVKSGKSLRTAVPKKVWDAFKDLVESPKNDEIRARLIEKIARDIQ